MTKTEIAKRIEELGNEVQDLKNQLDKVDKVGFEDDEMFLLSTHEYEQYKESIPHINAYWWLRSPGYYSNYAAYVINVGSVNFYGLGVDYVFDCVRPALKFKSTSYFLKRNETGTWTEAKIGDRIIAYNFPWIIIDKDLAIAEVPIAFRRFDDKSNDYETSEIRKFLKEWKNGRT